jgi:hypothetical protein
MNLRREIRERHKYEQTRVNLAYESIFSAALYSLISSRKSTIESIDLSRYLLQSMNDSMQRIIDTEYFSPDIHHWFHLRSKIQHQGFSMPFQSILKLLTPLS